MTPRDILSRPAPPPDLTLRYGPGPDHVADLRLPRGNKAAPLVLFLHGGFWRAEFDRAHTGSLATALAEAGYAVCTPEFRRVGQPGGGWPGTFDDVAAAVGTLPSLCAAAVGSGRLAAGRVVLAGHSAGGHLALWSAARQRLPDGSPWHPSMRPAPSGATPAGAAAPGAAPRGRSTLGVVALAPVSDLAACYFQGLGDGAAAALIGGAPDGYADRYAQADPAALLPLGCPARIVHGTLDDRVPCAMSRDYTVRATAAGDEVVLDELPGCGHFELIDPQSAAWLPVLAAFRQVAPRSAD